MTKEKSSKELVGIDGWLALFVVGLYVSAFIFVIVFLVSLLSELDILYLVSSLVFLTLLIYTIILMHKKDVRFPRYAIACLWFWQVFYIIISLPLIFLLHEDQAFYLGYFIGNLIASSIMSIIWTAYLIESKRVKNTFSPHAEAIAIREAKRELRERKMQAEYYKKHKEEIDKKKGKEFINFIKWIAIMIGLLILVIIAKSIFF